MRAIPVKVQPLTSLRSSSLLSIGVLLGVALPLHAEPPTRAATPPATIPVAPVHASHSRIGDVMGSLTEALRDAAEQQSHAGATPHPAQDAPSHDASAHASLPPDANAQATVP